MILYLGLNPPKGGNVIHFPMIRIVPRPFEFEDIYTHIVFTSQSTVKIFFNQERPSKETAFAAVGKKTKQCIESFGYTVSILAEEETAEGLAASLDKEDLSSAYLFWPHSALSRSVLNDYFEKKGIKYRESILYDTEPFLPGPHPPLEEIEEIIFTSPSTVQAYLTYFGKLPDNKKLTPIGTVTKNTLNQTLRI